MSYSPSRLSQPLLVPHCGLQRRCPARLVHVPVDNIGDEDVHLEARFPLALLEVGEMSKREEIEEDLGEATELEVKTNGEGKKCSEHEFTVSLKSTQGHELLPAEGGVEKRVAATSPPYHLQPAFSEAEIDDAAEKHREEYQAVKHQGGELEEEGKAKKLKVRDALIQLENLPKTDGEWIRGEIRQLG